MSFVNPGKRGILTVIALMLIVGVPGVIAYSDGSDDTYLSEFDTSGVEYVSVYDSSLGANNSFETECSDLGNGTYLVTFPSASTSSTSLDSLTSVVSYQFYLESVEVETISSEITFVSSIEDVSSVQFVLLNSTNVVLATFDMESDEDSDVWDLSISSVDAASADGATKVKFIVTAESAACPDEVELTYHFYEVKTIFTQDVVELIVMVGGIALLICGTFALSFIDVDTPGKAVSYAKRGIRSAGKKMRRGKK